MKWSKTFPSGVTPLILPSAKNFARSCLPVSMRFAGSFMRVFADDAFGMDIFISRRDFIKLRMRASLSIVAASFLLAKRQTADSESSLIVAMLTLYCTVILLPVALYQWQTPTLGQFLLLAGAAFFATAGQYCITQAFTKAPLTVLQPFTFLQLVWATLFGILLFSGSLDIFVIAGGCIIVAATSYMSHREMRRR